jgi:ABC-type branched-subunit amino acid transport system substrate-binding protein
MNTTLRGGLDRHRAVAAAATVASICLIGACSGGAGGGAGPGATRLNLVIGNSLPLTGESRALGASGEKASQIALDRITEAAGSAGADHTVRIVNADQGADSTSAIDSAKRLIDGGGATCLTGPWSSEAVARTAEEVTVPGKVLEITPVATGDDVAQLNDHDLVDSTALPVSTEGDALAKAIEQALGGVEGHTVSAAAGTDPSSTTVKQDFIRAWQDGNGTVGRQIVFATPPLGTSGTYSGSGSTSPPLIASQVSELTSGDPDAVLLADDQAGFLQVAPSLSSANGWDPALAWGNDQLVSPGLPDAVGSRAIEGMQTLAPGMPDDDAAASAFLSDFESADPRKVRIAPFAAQQFDATILCYLAAVAAGSTDGQKMADELIDITAPGGTKYSWQQLPQAIRALQDGEDIDYAGASGPIDMDVHGNAGDGVFDLYRYSSGRLENVGEIPVSKPNPATP